MLFVVTVSSSSLNSSASCLPFLDARSSSLSLWQPQEGCISAQEIFLWFRCYCAITVCRSVHIIGWMSNPGPGVLNIKPFDVQCVGDHAFIFVYLL